MHSECNRRYFLTRSAGLAAGIMLSGGCNKQSQSRIEVNGQCEMIAYCGQNCLECRIYLATIETNPEKQRQMREGIASYITKHFGTEIRPEDITDCNGCTTKNGKLFSGCQKCQVRKCAREKRLENCAYCSEYACEKLSRLFDSGSIEADAKKRLAEIKARL